jgi:predicted RNA methylase
MTQLPLIAGEQRRRDLSAWFTPPELARRIVDWALAPLAVYQTVLEPSAGIGALALAIRASERRVAIGSPTCFEIDPENCVRLRAHGFETTCGDFLAMEPYPDEPYDIAIMNPPFEGGQTERHIMHALKFADRVVCHCPLTTLAGSKRREGLWNKVHLHRLAICSSRPKYGAEGGLTDMCTIDVTMRTSSTPVLAETEVSWWP